jgi:hypothetical protein
MIAMFLIAIEAELLEMEVREQIRQHESFYGGGHHHGVHGEAGRVLELARRSHTYTCLSHEFELFSLLGSVLHGEETNLQVTSSVS